MKHLPFSDLRIYWGFRICSLNLPSFCLVTRFHLPHSTSNVHFTCWPCLYSGFSGLFQNYTWLPPIYATVSACLATHPFPPDLFLTYKNLLEICQRFLFWLGVLVVLSGKWIYDMPDALELPSSKAHTFPFSFYFNYYLMCECFAYMYKTLHHHMQCLKMLEENVESLWTWSCRQMLAAMCFLSGNQTRALWKTSRT